MNEQNPGSEPLDSAPAALPYHDRSTGLMIFGVMTILLGCLSGLLVLLMLLGQTMTAASNPEGSTSFAAIIPGILVYVVLAVALVWLGIGSFLGRRWARGLLLIFSWSWLLTGLVVMIAMGFLLPKIMASIPPPRSDAPPMPAAALDAVMAVMFVVDGFIFVLLPAIWTFFYSSRHVKATCEWRNPAPSWTDACPLPVLALVLWSGFSAVIMPATALASQGVAPFFGMFLTGFPGTLFYLFLAALWGCAAWLLYRLDLRGWWLILGTLGVFFLSTIITYSRHDIWEAYRLMGYPDAQVEQIQKLGILSGNNIIWLTSFCMLPLVGYLFFIKKYFPKNETLRP